MQTGQGLYGQAQNMRQGLQGQLMQTGQGLYGQAQSMGGGLQNQLRQTGQGLYGQAQSMGQGAYQQGMNLGNQLQQQGQNAFRQGAGMAQGLQGTVCNKIKYFKFKEQRFRSGHMVIAFDNWSARSRFQVHTIYTNYGCLLPYAPMQNNPCLGMHVWIAESF